MGVHTPCMAQWLQSQLHHCQQTSSLLVINGVLNVIWPGSKNGYVIKVTSVPSEYCSSMMCSLLSQFFYQLLRSTPQHQSVAKPNASRVERVLPQALLSGKKGTSSNQKLPLHCCVFYPCAIPTVWECWGCETAACRKLHVSYLHYNRLSSFSTEQPLIIQQSFSHPFGEALNCGLFCLSLVIIQVEIRNPRVLFKGNRG